MWSTVSLLARLKQVISPTNIWSMEEQDFYEDLITMGYSPDEASAKVENGRTRMQNIEELAAKRRAVKAEQATKDAQEVDKLVEAMDRHAPELHRTDHTHGNETVHVEGCEACRKRKWRVFHKEHLAATPKVTMDSTCPVCVGTLTAWEPNDFLAHIEAKQKAGERLTRGDKRKLRKLKKGLHKQERRMLAEKLQAAIDAQPAVKPAPIVAHDLTPKVTDEELQAAVLIMQTCEDAAFAKDAMKVIESWCVDRMRIMVLMHREPVPEKKPDPPKAPLLLPPAAGATTTRTGSGSDTAPDLLKEAGHPAACVCQGCEWFERELQRKNAEEPQDIRGRYKIKAKLNAIKRGEAVFTAGGLVYSREPSRDNRAFQFVCQDKPTEHEWVGRLDDKVVCPICIKKPSVWVAKPLTDNDPRSMAYFKTHHAY